MPGKIFLYVKNKYLILEKCSVSFIGRTKAER